MRLKKNLLLSFISIITLNKSYLSYSSSIMATMKKVPASKLGVSEPPPEWFGNPPNVCSSNWTNKNWLKSRFHFSFAEYSNARNQNFGVLRVMNDDLVQPARGFGEHPHRDVDKLSVFLFCFSNRTRQWTLCRDLDSRRRKDFYYQM